MKKLIFDFSKFLGSGHFLIHNICNAIFGRNWSLKTHVETIHEGMKQFKCDICNAEFTSKQGMEEHVTTIHEGKKETIHMLHL